MTFLLLIICEFSNVLKKAKTVKGSWGRWVFFRLKSLESLKTHGRKNQWWKNQLRRNQRWNLRSIWTTLLVFSSIAVWKIGQNTNHTSLVISFEQHLFKWPRDINCYLSWELAINNLTLFLASILDWVGVKQEADWEVDPMHKLLNCRNHQTWIWGWSGRRRRSRLNLWNIWRKFGGNWRKRFGRAATLMQKRWTPWTQFRFSFVWAILFCC